MSNTKLNSNTLCATYTNEELRSLLNEITEIGGMDKPKDAKKSKNVGFEQQMVLEHPFACQKQHNSAEMAVLFTPLNFAPH